ncbi:MAG: GNAT family N-acetyltransferase [Microlunatus sp.]|nr:GNAT family N-acetyltransferase [Microlunatus sp.]
MTAVTDRPLLDRHGMRLLRVDPADRTAVTASVELLNTAQRVDDPDELPGLPELSARWLEFGWDLDPETRYLYVNDAGEPVAVLEVDLPRRDNRHLLWGNVIVHPDHRGRGHGTALVAELARRAEEAGRTTIWLEVAEDDTGGRAFLEGLGFRCASHDARRRQVLADADPEAIEARHAEAVAAAADYRIERLTPPYPDGLLGQLIEVTAAINDAPMGDLTFEDEVFDVARLRDLETARIGRGDVMYRLAARHAETGEIGGHTMVLVNPLRPRHSSQGDTAVHRDHRGRRLGLLLKIGMMRWLAETEPKITEITTWNQTDNRYMIDVNEAIGYRLSRVFATYERTA